MASGDILNQVTSTVNKLQSAISSGGPSTFDSGTYKTTGLMYPDDLMGANNQYGNNYVIFYINVHEDSMIVAQSGSNIVPNATLGMRGSVAGSTVSPETMAAMGMAATASAVKASGITEKATFNTLGGKTAAGVDLVGGALAGKAIVDKIGKLKAQYKRLNTSIALYMPSDLNIKYGVSWSETSLAGTEAMMAIGENVKSIIEKSNMSDAGKQASPALESAKKTGTSYLAGLGMQAPGVGEYISKSSGTAANPKKEQLFKDVDFRTFSFSYQFFPRSSAEAKNVLAIIKQFKLHMHPEYKKDSNNFLYIYPSEFDIKYYQNGEENTNLHKHTSCVLTDLSINYSPQGTFTSFPDGMPTQISMNMTFKELATLSKETIMEGF